MEGFLICVLFLTGVGAAFSRRGTGRSAGGGPGGLRECDKGRAAAGLGSGGRWPPTTTAWKGLGNYQDRCLTNEITARE